MTAPANLVYAYRLDPLEPSFSAFGAATTKAYTSIANGNYTFIVKSKDQAGNEDAIPANDSVNFAVVDGGSFKVFAAGWQNAMFQNGVGFTLTANFADGSSASASATLP